MIYVSREIILAAFFCVACEARNKGVGQVDESPGGANARGAFGCCMVENSGVSCRGEIEVLFYGAGGKP